MRRVAIPCFVILLLLGACARRPADSGKVRLVLVTLDTLRYDGLVPADGEPSPMPLLWERARQGAVFERHYSATSITQPTHASLFTALHPWEHGVVDNGQVLGDEVETVAEVLAAEGFATAAAVASFPMASRFGFAQGFGEYFEDFDQSPISGRRWEGKPVPGDRFYSFAERITDTALGQLDRLEQSGATRQFLWLHYFDPHDPYGDASPPGPVVAPRMAIRKLTSGLPVRPELLAQFRLGYDRDLGALDRELDRLLRRLAEDDAELTTHVVITSDHGESFGEAGALAHGKRLTPEQIRVPLVIFSPRLAPGRRPEVSGSVDVASTLVDLAGIERSTAPWSRGRSLVESRASDGRSSALAAFGMRRRSHGKRTFELRTDGSRHELVDPFFYAVDSAGNLVRGNARELADPATGGVAEERYRELFAAFETRLAAGGAERATDPENARALRALGYVQ